MEVRYTIMQKSPYPGWWQRIEEWQIQTAEFALGFNRTHYYERAARTDKWKLCFYRLEDAELILAYWKRRYPFADFMLMGAPFPMELIPQ